MSDRKPWVLGGPRTYSTQLGDQEPAFRSWVTKNNVPFDPDAAQPQDYDMRGFYKGIQQLDPRASSAVDANDGKLHYPDYWKTPEHETFSKESQWATPDAPSWNEKDQLVTPGGKMLFDDRANSIGDYLPKETKMAKGGGVDAALNIARQAKGHTGPLMSAIGGRTDHIPLDVPAGAYVLPADHVSALGQGNTLNGLNVLDHMFKTKTAGKVQPKLKRANGGNVPIIAAGGEYVVSPEQVAQIGGGDMDHGHAILDQWVKTTRKDHISTLKNLPGPER